MKRSFLQFRSFRVVTVSAFFASIFGLPHLAAAYPGVGPLATVSSLKPQDLQQLATRSKTSKQTLEPGEASTSSRPSALTFGAADKKLRLEPLPDGLNLSKEKSTYQQYKKKLRVTFGFDQPPGKPHQARFRPLIKKGAFGVAWRAPF